MMLMIEMDLQDLNIEKEYLTERPLICVAEELTENQQCEASDLMRLENDLFVDAYEKASVTEEFSLLPTAIEVSKPKLLTESANTKRELQPLNVTRKEINCETEQKRKKGPLSHNIQLMLAYQSLYTQIANKQQV